MVNLRTLVGTKMTPELEKEIKDSGFDVRIIKYGHLYTCDWRPERVNIHLDEDEVVTEIRNG